MLRSYFDYIFVHLRQKARLRPKLSPKFCQISTRKARPDLQRCADSRFSSQTLLLCGLEKDVLRLFPIGASSLPVVVAQPDETLANKTQRSALRRCG